MDVPADKGKGKGPAGLTFAVLEVYKCKDSLVAALLDNTAVNTGNDLMTWHSEILKTRGFNVLI